MDLYPMYTLIGQSYILCKRITMGIYHLLRPGRIGKFLLILHTVVHVFGNGEYSNSLIVPLGQELILNCSKAPQTPGNWMRGDETVYINRIPTKAYYRETFRLLDDYSLQVMSVNVNTEGIYTCNVDKETAQVYKIEVEVQPLLNIKVNGETNITTVYIKQDEETSVKCIAKASRPEVNLTCEIDFEEPHILNYTISKNRRDVSTYDTYLEISFIPRRSNGTIKCISSGLLNFPAQIAETQYETYVIPRIQLSINDRSHHHVVELQLLQTVTAVCSSFGSRPNDRLSWLINDTPFSFTGISHNISTRRSAKCKDCYDSISYLRYQLVNIEGSFVCISQLNHVGIVQSVQTNYTTYVIPTVEVTINGKKNDRIIEVEEDIAFQITCNVRRSRPAVAIMWLLDNETLVPTEMTVNATHRDEGDTFNSVSSFTLKIRRMEGSVTCVCVGLPTGRMYSHAQFVVNAIEPVAKHSFVMMWGILVVSSVIVLTLMLTILKCYTGPRRDSHPTSQVALDEGPSTLFGKMSSDSFKQDHTESLELEHDGIILQRKNSTYKPPSIGLPNIPECSGTSVYSGIPNAESGHYYATIKDKASRERLFQRKDVCFILEMKLGDIYMRWMGTMALPSKKKCVVLTTVRDIFQGTGEFHWDIYVKRLLDLPTSKNITTIEGVCIDGANLYVVTEHVTCETLENVIDPSHQNLESIFLDPITSHDWTMTSYVLDILEGVEFIQSYGFLHPGLTARKVLVTAERTCRLYDFCLSEDAINRMKLIKSRASEGTLQNIPPESLQRNEYAQSSDVWSVAAVICYILSPDQSFQSVHLTLSTENDFSSKLKEKIPTRFLEFETLMKCLENDCKQRPTVSTLKTLFRQKTRENETYETPRNGLSDTYVPMATLIGRQK